MSIENSYTDIFTEFDESIFSDGSIDPVGLRIIWTSLGNAIFKNKLNTISTDIRYYTINLFHHYLIQKVRHKYEDELINIVGMQPYFNEQDLYDGIIIFLESLLTHVVHRINHTEGNTYITVPGTSKLAAIIAESPEDRRVKYLQIDRRAGILVRHLLLGIHGRHKGPFQQMGIFNKNNYYSQRSVWEEAGQLFAKAPWNTLTDSLEGIIKEYVFERTKTGIISAPVEDVVNHSLLEAYRNVLQEENFKETELINYWGNHLGLLEGAAHVLYSELRRTDNKTDFENIIKRAAEKGQPDDYKYIKAICAIEPLIARIEKTTNRLLQRGTNEIDSSSKEMTVLASDLAKTIATFSSTLSGFTKDASVSSADTKMMKNSIFTTLAKIDHVIFKINAYESMTTRKLKQEFSDHENCRLGKWYATTGIRDLGDAPSFKKLVSHHKLVHDMVFKNIEFIKNKDTVQENKTAIIENFEVMEVESERLFLVLEDIVNESKELIYNKVKH